jgi:hypothetical protein
MTSAPVIKANSVFEPEQLSPNPFLNIEVVSEISRNIVEESNIGDFMR